MIHICKDCDKPNGYPVQGLCIYCYARRQGYSNIELRQLRHTFNRAQKKTATAATVAVHDKNSFKDSLSQMNEVVQV